MPLRISIVLPSPNRGLTTEQIRTARAYDFQNAMNATARINADWVLREWKAGRDPKCCAACNGTRYAPDLDYGDEIQILTTPQLFTAGRGSCCSIAACHTGHKIAEAYMGRLDPKKYPRRDGQVGSRDPLDYPDACDRFIVKLAPGPDPKKPLLLHAICDDDGLILDPTIGMQR